MKILTAALTSLSAIAANAGSITFEAPQDLNIEIEPNIGSGGSWVIPAIIVAIMAAALLTKPGNNNTL